MLMLFCMMLIFYAEENKCDDTYGAYYVNDNVAPCCRCCCVAFETSLLQNTRIFWPPQTRSFKHERNTRAKHNDTHGICNTSASKMHQKTITINLGRKTCCETWSYSRKPQETQDFQALDQKCSKKATHPPRRQTHMLPSCCCCRSFLLLLVLLLPTMIIILIIITVIIATITSTSIRVSVIVSKLL